MVAVELAKDPTLSVNLFCGMQTKFSLRCTLHAVASELLESRAQSTTETNLFYPPS